MSGNIYKLTGGGLTYYGSTTKSLGTRKSQHKYDHAHYLTNGNKYLTAYEVMGADDWDIELVEYGLSEEQMKLRERWHIENNECVNKYVPGRTKAEYARDHKEKIAAYKKQYAIDNQDYINVKYHLNKDDINSKRRLYESSDEFKLKKREAGIEYRRRNKAKIAAQKRMKAPCSICGKSVSKSNLRQHQKAKSCKITKI